VTNRLTPRPWRPVRAFLVVAALVLAATPVATGQPGASPTAPSPATPASEGVETAPVLLDGETLFTVRGISAFPAAQRAAEIARRIHEVAADDTIPTRALRVSEMEDWSDILAGERRLMRVFDVDGQVEGMPRRAGLAEAYQRKIVAAIEGFRLERSRPYLIRQGFHAALVLALLTALLMAVRWTFRRLEAAIARRTEASLTALEATSYRLLSVEQVTQAWRGALRAVHVLLGFLLAFAAFHHVLSLFPWTRLVGRRGTALLIDPLRTMGLGLLDALPGLVFIAILTVITRYVLKLVWLFFGGVAAGRIRPTGFEQEWAWPTYRLVRLAIIAFALVVAYPYIPGSDTNAFKGVSIFVGVLMSFGAASMVANVLAGYALIYRRAFKVGDRIQVGDVVGDVVAMRQQVTHLRTPKNEEVTIPSSMLLNSQVINYSTLASERGLILHATVGIGYETPWRQVEAMLIEAANRTPGLLREPPPFVLQTSLGDFAVTHEINVYCDRPQEMARLYTDLRRNVLDVFNEYGVQIMTPAYEGDPAAPKIVPQDQWFRTPANRTDPGGR
jgi:small-conductance mechanosensitive channel